MSVFAKMFRSQVVRVCLFAVLFISVAQVQAADAYYDYVADLHLHESHQARHPKHVIEYAQGEEGVLLR